MEEQRVQGNWKEIKREIIHIWGDLTENDLEQSKGNLHRILDMVEEKYGEERDEIEEKMNRFLKKYSPH